jgi:hypothetical protein
MIDAIRSRSFSPQLLFENSEVRIILLVMLTCFETWCSTLKEERGPFCRESGAEEGIWAQDSVRLLITGHWKMCDSGVLRDLGFSPNINPLTPELNPSAQCCLPRFLLGF